MNKKIGFMQGRLLPKFMGFYQAHPIRLWELEFKIASDLRLNSVEFIFDDNSKILNPLLNHSGLKKIKNLSKKYNINVSSICADYFMDHLLFTKNKLEIKKNNFYLKKLINASIFLKCKNIVLPFVDKSSLKKNKKNFINLKNNLKFPVKYARKNKINLVLETDLEPKNFLNLLNFLDNNIFKINYDIGNSASLGFNPLEEISSYGHLISVLHIKDRKLNGGSVILGKGDAKFDLVFKKLQNKFKGVITLQCYRDHEGLSIFKKQLNWLRNKKYFKEFIKT